MKLFQSLFVAALVAVPAVSFAQSVQPLTRAQVRAELVQLEQAGYNPGNGYDATYPRDIQAAEARVHAADSAYGPSTNGSSAAGAPAVSAQDSTPGLGPIYARP
jgi:hypothetical protein